MTRYIDKDALVAEFNRLIAELIEEGEDTMFEQGRISAFEDAKLFINTLEVKEVDLNKEIDNIWNPRFNLGWDEKSLLSINHEGFTTFAKHFFELGMAVCNKPQKEE